MGLSNVFYTLKIQSESGLWAEILAKPIGGSRTLISACTSICWIFNPIAGSDAVRCFHERNMLIRPECLLSQQFLCNLEYPTQTCILARMTHFLWLACFPSRDSGLWCFALCEPRLRRSRQVSQTNARGLFMCILNAYSADPAQNLARESFLAM
jgi:hypothetical protein